jgi:hypothetical protein
MKTYRAETITALDEWQTTLAPSGCHSWQPRRTLIPKKVPLSELARNITVRKWSSALVLYQSAWVITEQTTVFAV